MRKSAAKRVRAHHEALAPKMGSVAATFHTRLFERTPSIAPSFASDHEQRERQFIAALATIAKNLDRLDVLEEPLMQLGERHLECGIPPEHYSVVRDELIGTLSHHSGSEWSEQLERDWFLGLSLVCEALLKGVLRAAEHRAATPAKHAPQAQPVVRPLGANAHSRKR